MQLQFPDDVVAVVRRKYTRHHRRWLGGEGTWPLQLPLGAPTERQAAEELPRVRRWVDAWREYPAAGRVVWEERRWPRLGEQRLPCALVMDSPQVIAQALGLAATWGLAAQRYAQLASRWPALATAAALTDQFDYLASAPEAEWQRLVTVLAWFQQNSASGLYLRQLPIPGIDTKWLETQEPLVHGLLGAILGRPEPEDFLTRCGLRRSPTRLRMRVLCPALQAQMGGLTDIEAPLNELGALQFRPARGIVVENLRSGLALPEIAGAVCFLGLGNAATLLGELPWLAATELFYWGDIDTHGFAILNRVRRAFPLVRSWLMDEQTLLQNRELWVEELTQSSDIRLELLTEEEHAVYEGLRNGKWGPRVRLEQERIPWTAVSEALGILERW